ncbi:MAG: hypothetical protein ACLSEY_14655 [Enterocloster sp.]
MNKSSVEAVDEAQEKQRSGEKARTLEYQFNKAQEEVKTAEEKNRL